MGEKSKSIGERGEKKILDFLKAIGWENPKTNFDIACDSQADHVKPSSKSGERKSHGVDAMYNYICPYSPKVHRVVLVSMKDSDEEKTSDRTALVKSDLKDLSTLSECFEVSEEHSQFYSAENGADTLMIHKLLIRLNKDQETERQFLPMEKKRDLAFGSKVPPYFLQNDRFDYIDSCLRYLELNIKGDTYHYFITRNSLNLDGSERKTESSFLPLQNLIGGPIVVRSNNEQGKSLLVFSAEDFTEITLRRMIGLAQTCGNGWASKVFLIFETLPPDVEEQLQGVKQLLNDQSFAESLECRSRDQRRRMS